jgi:hypothetical protein
MGRYPILITPKAEIEPQRKTFSEVRHREFYIYKQIKFELFLIFAVNLTPIFFLICGEHNLIQLVFLIYNLLGILYLETVNNQMRCPTCIVYNCFLIKIVFSVQIINNSKESYFLKTISELSVFNMSQFSIWKICAPDFFAFVIFALYILYKDRYKETRRELKKALSYERTFDTPQSI